ncbi:MAG: CotH kinase family protein [Chitinispirillaceae bacterium]|nr:CotH kinase family protein [Chitinispirillaceae bacterium]
MKKTQPDSLASGQCGSNSFSSSHRGVCFFKSGHLPHLAVAMLLTVVPCNALNKIEITIDPQHIAYLDQNPFYDTSFAGTFSCDSTVYAPTKLNYRGSYTIFNQIKYKLLQRNWKVKVPKAQPYRNYRVWNYNYEPFLSHNLAYELMGNAGVPCAGMRQVKFYVNGALHGLYSEFPDPDNKKWLKAAFGDTSDSFVGDLFKAATDKPNLTRKYFADLTVLGANDSDYYLHYNKKSNDSTDQAAGDYRSIRSFIKILNETPDHQFADTIDKYFDVVRFLKYLTVANYMDFWDGYPNRAKNYWLYLNPYTGKWVFIPWDMDATFDPVRAFYNNMGTECSYLFMYNETNLSRYYTSLYQTSDNGKSEISPRPLFTRIMNIVKYRDLYGHLYKEALSTYLKKEIILAKLDSLSAVVRQAGLSRLDSLKVDTSRTTIETFIQRRSASLETQLSAISTRQPLILDRRPAGEFSLKVNSSTVHITNLALHPVSVRLYQATGRSIAKANLPPGSHFRATCPVVGILLYEISTPSGSMFSTGTVVLR